MTLVAELRTAWDAHRPYVLFSVGLFALGSVVGVAMVGRFDLLAALGLDDLGDLFPGEISVGFLFLNNSRVLFMLVVGALSAGLLTLVILVFNGLILGYFLTPITLEQGPLFTAVGILPHGVFELFAFFVAGGIGFRIVKRSIDRIRGKRDVVLGRDGWRRTGALFLVAWMLIAVAAVIEMYVTTALLELLFA